MTVTAAQIGAIAAALRRAEAREVEVSGAGWSLRLVLPETADAPLAKPEPLKVSAPGVGSFLPEHPMMAGPLVPDGGAVAQGDIVGLIAVGPIYRPVLAPGSGRLGPCLVESNTLVGFGTTLFHIEPAVKE